MATNGQPLPNEELLSLREVARWLSVSQRTVHRLRRAGHLRPYWVGGRLRFDPQDVRAYLGSRREGPPSNLSAPSKRES